MNYSVGTAEALIGVVTMCLILLAYRFFKPTDFEFEVEDPGELYNIDALRALAQANPIADAISAMDSGDNRWLGCGFPSPEVPGVPKHLLNPDSVRWLPGTGFSLCGPGTANLRENICKYTLQYNSVLLERSHETRSK